MTVNELRQALAALPGEMDVHLQIFVDDDDISDAPLVQTDIEEYEGGEKYICLFGQAEEEDEEEDEEEET